MPAKVRIEINGRSECFATPEEARDEIRAILGSTVCALLEVSRGKAITRTLKDGRGRTVGSFSFEWEEEG